MKLPSGQRAALKRVVSLARPRTVSSFQPPLNKPATASPFVLGGASLSPRWLSDLQAQAREITKSGTVKDATNVGTKVMQELEERWLELLAGSEGFLSGPRWSGLANHEIVWGNMDSMVRHVNNVMYNRFAESSRVNFFRNFALAAEEEHKQQWIDLMTPRSVGLILKSIKTDFKFPLTYPDSITVLHKLLKKPTYESSNIEVEVLIISHKEKRIAARCYEDVVVYDYRIAKKATMEKFMVDELCKAYELQEDCKRRALEEIQELQRALE